MIPVDRGLNDVDEAYVRLRNVIDLLCRASLLMKRTNVQGGENFVRTGGTIIVANHVGSFKDIAVLLRAVPRRVFFMANERLFSPAAFRGLVRAHLLRHLKGVGAAADLLLTPMTSWFVRTISGNIARIGTIPVDLERRTARAFAICRSYLMEGRAIISLQGMGIIQQEQSHPYVPSFRSGPARLAYDLYEKERLEMPVIPLAIHGAHLAWAVPSKIEVRVGEPMYVSHYWERDRERSVKRFQRGMEAAVRKLVGEMIRGGRRP